MLVIVCAACGIIEDNVYLDGGSQGVAGNGRVENLESGAMYLLRNGQNWYTVKGDGTVGARLYQLNSPLLASAVNTRAIAPLNDGVTAITGLSNDMNISVYKYYRPEDHFYISSWSLSFQGAESVTTWLKNTVIDLNVAAAFDRTSAYFNSNALDTFSEIIFVTPDVYNAAQEAKVTGGSPVVNGGTEWEYRLVIGTSDISDTRPLWINVGSDPGEKGYFRFSGEMPQRFTMYSKRNSADSDRPNQRPH
jgi:hypothetical protein